MSTLSGYLFLVLASSVCLSIGKDLDSKEKSRNSDFKGHVCNINKLPVNGDNPQTYIACVKPKNQDWPWKDSGIWTEMRCQGSRVFSPAHRGCHSPRKVQRRQQQYCNQYNCNAPQPIINNNCYGTTCQQPSPSTCYSPPCQQPVVQPVVYPQPQPIVQPVVYPQPCRQPNCQPYVDNSPRPCPNAPVTGAGSPNAACSWMVERLRAYNGNRASYLQCVPAGPPGQYCGRWMVRPCAPATVFSAPQEVCIHDQRGSGCLGQNCGQPQPQNVCRPQQQYFSACNQQRQCPGNYMTCTQNSCCQPAYGR